MPTVIAPLSRIQQHFLFWGSLLLVGFGQPAWSRWFGILASVAGYALFFRILLNDFSRRERFLLSTAWFFGVQVVQLSWLASHPYYYIFAFYFIAALCLGVQFGLICLFVTSDLLRRYRSMLAFASLWTLMEWSRLFVLSGYSLNPAGLAATGSLYALQTASIWGVFGLTFWVMFLNLLTLKNWFAFPSEKRTCALWLCVLCFPFLYGVGQIAYHSPRLAKTSTFFRAALVQTAFPAEEAFEFKDSKSFIAFVFDEWHQILHLVKKHQGHPLDLVALPEFVVPLGTYSFVYPYDAVKNAFVEVFGKDSLRALPSLEEPLAKKLNTATGSLWVVNNAFWAQTLANYFDAPLIAGMEDAEDNETGEREHYSAAILFTPKAPNEAFDALRYSKRVLVPMAEYIPFSFCRELAAGYGIQGSFTCGKEAVAWDCKGVPIGVSICYEETFGSIMRESTRKGAKASINLTSDVWFPDSKLTRQHLDHARLRTVENGIPLLRSCNTGITCALDCLGRTIAELNETQDGKWLADSLEVKVPLYTYSTIYSRYGDMPVLLLCVTFIGFWGLFFVRKP